ncbi:RNA methyltransferase [Spirochaetia bacterium]|nr:RNA methyltransferase [Spirochaetia bacterium]
MGLMVLSDIIIILSRPSESGNVGAVCRAMKNMGLSRLRIVASQSEACPQGEACPQSEAGAPRESPDGHASFDEAALRARAVHAADIWEGAEFFDTLAEASADCSLLIGTTRRRGHHRKNVTMDPKELAAWLRDRPGPSLEGNSADAGNPTAGRTTGVTAGRTAGRTALVFGNERTGLEDDELALCNIASHIPVSEAFPSLNLSHAVQVYAYELFQAMGPMASIEGSPPAPEKVKGAWVPLSREQADALTAAVTKNLETLGFYRHPGRAEQERFIRDFISRAGLTEQEGRYFRDIFAKAARLAHVSMDREKGESTG